MYLGYICFSKDILERAWFYEYIFVFQLPQETAEECPEAVRASALTKWSPQ